MFMQITNQITDGWIWVNPPEDEHDLNLTIQTTNTTQGTQNKSLMIHLQNTRNPFKNQFHQTEIKRLVEKFTDLFQILVLRRRSLTYWVWTVEFQKLRKLTLSKKDLKNKFCSNTEVLCLTKMPTFRFPLHFHKQKTENKFLSHLLHLKTNKL